MLALNDRVVLNGFDLTGHSAWSGQTGEAGLAHAAPSEPGGRKPFKTSDAR